MIVCDLTHAYHETSGGIRTFITAKRQYTLDRTRHTHALIVPGEKDETTAGERWRTIQLQCPRIPGAGAYRFFPSSNRPAKALWSLGAEVVELGTFFMPAESRAAFRHRARMRASGRPCLVTAFVHTDFDRSYATTYPSKVFGRWLGRRIGAMAGWYTRSVLSKCDAVYCLAPSFQDHLRGLGIPNVTVIPLGVDTDVFSPARRDLALRDQLGVPDDGVMVVYAGRLDSEKRTDIMVAAAELAHQKHPLLLVLAGTGPNRALLEEQEAAGLPIRVLDYVSDPLELARLLASADLYLTAGPFETFGLSVVEAQACGLPVVGVQAGALIERVRPEFGFLGPVDDSGIMATHILAAAGARDSLGEAARKHVVTNLSWTHTFQSLFESYCTLIKNT